MIANLIATAIVVLFFYILLSIFVGLEFSLELFNEKNTSTFSDYMKCISKCDGKGVFSYTITIPSSIIGLGISKLAYFMEENTAKKIESCINKTKIEIEKSEKDKITNNLKR